MEKKAEKDAGKWLIVISGLVLLTLATFFATAAPQGANIVTNFTEPAPTNPPTNRTDDGGSITFLNMSTVQQNQAWKAYVGNVSGRLTLDDSNGNTIYDWSIAADDVQGEVYVTRNDSVSWTSIECANESTISAEESFLGMGSTDNDNLNQTFDRRNHSFMQIGTVPIDQDTCESTATYINDTSQTVTNTTPFQEILLQDTNAILVYATFIDQNTYNYKSGTNETYDFQLIVGEDDVSGPNTYYFYLEID